MSANAKAALVSLACSFLFITPALCAGHPDKLDHPHSASKASVDVRNLRFPEKSLGALLLIDERNDCDIFYTYRQGKQVGSAQGAVTLTVPPDHVLVMDANRRVFENPILLKEVSPGLDGLKLSFMSMEDREDHMLERAMPYVENLKGLRVLTFDRSEISDSEILKLKNLPRLCYINFFLSQIDGACFKHLSEFPELYQLDVPCCNINQKYIADLAQLRKLRYLDLSRTGMSIVGAKSMSKLTTVTRMDLAQNANFDDQCMKYLQPLTKLVWLDLRQTKVTFEGIKYLRGIKIKQLFIPSRCRKNLAEIKTMFPSAALVVETAPVAMSRDDKIIYGPLK